MGYNQNAEQEKPIGGDRIKTSRTTIENNYRYHKPGEAVEKKHETVRNYLQVIAQEMDELLPRGREAQIVQIKLEEAMFWAGAAIARNQE